VESLFALPGNPGIAPSAELLEGDPCDPAAVVDAARGVGADLVVVGPEAPLAAGVSEALEDAGIAVFGPTSEAARIESSKAFAKEVMAAARVRTARGRSFEDPAAARSYLDRMPPPYVVKADGLAAGKGVVVTSEHGEAAAAVDDMLSGKRFAAAGARVLIEECLSGPEVSLIAVTDGRTVLPLAPAQDYKRARDGDRGPNTGGMGSYSPVPLCPEDLAETVAQEMMKPVIDELARRGTPFVGALYAGLMLTEQGPKVLEFNARFGDPETQVILPRLQSDFGAVAYAAATGDLAGVSLSFRQDAAVCVVLASGGYPDDYRTGVPIQGVDDAESLPGIFVFHAGTKLKDGELVTAGGRVLAVTALGRGLAQARERAYRAASCVHFDGKQARSDIALVAQTG
jgi:phosphoribosylamine--glycine ligase